MALRRLPGRLRPACGPAAQRGNPKPTGVVCKVIGTRANTWHGVQLRHLVALEAVAEERSFSAAAHRLGYTQSAVSGQILSLERIVGVRVIDRIRGSRPLQLTGAGEILLRHASAINGRLDSARSEISALNEGTDAPLRVAVNQAVSRSIVPQTLRRLAAEDPEADIDLREVYDQQRMLDLLERGRVDVGFTTLPIRNGPFAARAIYRDDHVVVVRDDDVLAEQDEIPLERLVELELIAIEDCRAQDGVEAALEAAGTPLHVIRRLESTASILAFVAAGLGAGFIPQLAADMPDNLVALRLPAEVPPRVIALVSHRETALDRRAERFVEIAIEVSASLSSRLPIPVLESAFP